MNTQIARRQRAKKNGVLQLIGRLGGDVHEVFSDLAAGDLENLSPLRVDVLAQGLALWRGGFLESVVAGDGLGVNQQRALKRFFAGGKNSVERIVIGDGNGIVLVIVAARARHGEAEQATRHRVNLVINLVGRVVAKHAAEREEAHAREAPALNRRLDEVGGNLLADELVVRRVGVKGADDVIAICVGVRPNAVGSEGKHKILGVRVARDVKPVASPAFTVSRRGQQAIDNLRKGIRRIIRDECLHLGKGRW